MDKKEFSKYLTFDKPIPYKKLLIYPALLVDYYEFYDYVTCLLIDKNSIPDANVISMSYLEFLFILSTSGDMQLFKLDKLLKLVCRFPNTKKIVVDGKEVEEPYIRFYMDEVAKPYFEIDGETYGYEDFDKIKDIICMQNEIEQIDETITKELRDELDRALVTKSRMSDVKMCGLEDQITGLSVATGLSYDNIYKMTIRKFNKAMARVDKLLTWKIYTQASLSGLVSFPKNTEALNHWLSDLTKDKYDDVKANVDTVRKNLFGGYEKVNHLKD